MKNFQTYLIVSYLKRKFVLDIIRSQEVTKVVQRGPKYLLLSFSRAHILHDCSTTSKPENCHWYNVCL